MYHKELSFSIAISVFVLFLSILNETTDKRIKMFLVFSLVFAFSFVFSNYFFKSKFTKELKMTLEQPVCDSHTCDENQKILDPKYNLRECAKQMILLEDHLNNPEKRCKQCIIKHMLNIEALAEEGISLVKNDDKICENDCIAVATTIKQDEKDFADGKDYHLIAQNIRESRKDLMQKYFQLANEN
jgi:hypothetical protein